jgi:hypothetical protein
MWFEDENVEIMDGPTNDEKLGLMRVKAKSLLDGVEGWMTLEGNQGTPFMKKVVLNADSTPTATSRSSRTDEELPLISYIFVLLGICLFY